MMAGFRRTLIAYTLAKHRENSIDENTSQQRRDEAVSYGLVGSKKPKPVCDHTFHGDEHWHI
jgi:hypothetical protein